MKSIIAHGWKLTGKHLPIVIFLFLYRLGWGFLIYRIVDNIVTPLLKRFPAAAPHDYAVQSFMTEAQFRLFKTDMIMPYVWTIVALMGARMLLAPFLQSGLLHSIRSQINEQTGTRFRQGIKKFWKPIMLIYWLEAIAVILPLWWIAPKLFRILMTSPALPQILIDAAPWLGGWGLWAVLVHLFSIALQIGIVQEGKLLPLLGQIMIRLLPFVLITLFMWLIAAAAASLFVLSALVWAGFLTLLLKHLGQFITTWIKIWTLASQSIIMQKKNHSE